MTQSRKLVKERQKVAVTKSKEHEKKICMVHGKVLALQKKLEEFGKRRFFVNRRRRFVQDPAAVARRTSHKYKDNGVTIQCARMIQDLRAGVPIEKARADLKDRIRRALYRVSIARSRAGKAAVSERAHQQHIDEDRAEYWTPREVRMIRPEDHIRDDVPFGAKRQGEEASRLRVRKKREP